MSAVTEKLILAAGCAVFGVASLVFIYLDQTLPGFFAVIGMLVCRRGMGKVE